MVIMTHTYKHTHKGERQNATRMSEPYRHSNQYKKTLLKMLCWLSLNIPYMHLLAVEPDYLPMS